MAHVWCHLCLQEISEDIQHVSLSVVLEKDEALLACASTITPSGQNVVMFCPTCTLRAIQPDGSTLLRLSAVEENTTP